MADRPVRRGAPASPGQAQQLPKGGASQLNEQLAAFRELQAQQAPQEQSLQQKFATGQISLSQYNDQIGELWQQQLGQQAQQLQAQGKSGMAAGAEAQLAQDQGKPAPEGVQLSPFSAPPKARFDNQDDELVYGPTGKPDQSVFTGMGPAGQLNVPADVQGWLHYLEEAAAQPNAPAQAKQLYSLLAHYLGS